MNETVMALAMETNTSISYYKELALDELSQTVKTYNAVAERMKRDAKKRTPQR